MVSPEFVLRGFSNEPSACCGCLVSNKACLVVGFANGSIELWNLTTFRPICQSNGSVFPSKSPILCLREISAGVVAVESKVHELAFFKIAPPPENFVHLFTNSIKEDEIAPSFCQFDSTNLATTGFVIARSGQESSLTLFSAELSCLSNNRNTVLDEPQSLGKVGAVMFVKFVSVHSNIIRLVCGYESSHVILWSVNQEDNLKCDLLNNFALTSLFDKTKDQEDMDICPTCCDAACPPDNPPFLIIGSTSNAIFKMTLNDDLTVFTATLGRTPSKGVTAIRIRPSDRKLAAIGFSDGSICLVSPKNLSVLGTLLHHRLLAIGLHSISALDFINAIPETNKWILAASCRDKTVSIWDIYNNNKTGK